VFLVFGAVYVLINFSTSASAISNDVACLSGTATEYLVSRSYIVSIYEISLSVVWSGPTISMDALSNAEPVVPVMTMGCRVFKRTNFFNWQSRHSCIYLCISDFLPEQK
jgi:hypothetical protein